MKPAVPSKPELGLRLFLRRESGGYEVHGSEVLPANALEEIPSRPPSAINHVSSATRAAALALIASRARSLERKANVQQEKFTGSSNASEVLAPIVLHIQCDDTWPVTLSNRLLTPGAEHMFSGFGSDKAKVLLARGGRVKGKRGHDGILPGNGLRLGLNEAILQMANIPVFELASDRSILRDSIP